MGGETRQFDTEDMAALKAIHQGILDGTLAEVVRGLVWHDEGQIADAGNGITIECVEIPRE